MGVRRALAWLIDFALVCALAVGLGSWAFHHASAIFAAEKADLTSSTATALMSGREVRGMAVDAGRSLWSEAALVVHLVLAALVLIVFLYHFGSMAWRGRTIGKALFDLRVCPAEGTPELRRGLPVGRAAGRAAVRTLTDIGVFVAACWAVVDGRFTAALVLWIAAIAVFWLNLVPAVGRRRRTVGDRLTGTTVADGGLYRAAIDAANRGGRAAAGHARTMLAGSEPARQVRTTLARTRDLYRTRRPPR